MKRLMIATAAVALAATAIPAVAAEDDGLIPEKIIPGSFSANVDVVSEYIFRGISQTDGEPAIQGGFDWSLDSQPVGAYAGTWLSNVNFGTSGTIEWDLYGGLQGDLGFASWKAGGIWFHYPRASRTDYGELALSLDHDFGMFGVTASFNYSPSFYNNSGEAEFANVAVGIPLGKVTLGLNGGRQWISDNATFGTPDYWVYGASLAAKIVGFNTTLAVTDTDLTQAQCFGGSNLCGTTVTLMVARSF